MNSLFLVDDDVEYTYDTLLSDINRCTSYFPLYQSGNLYDYFLNLILALTANKPLILIDADLRHSQISGVDTALINCAEPLTKKTFKGMREVLDEMEKSTSEISIFTSGTTGQPKEVIHNLHSLSRAVRVSVKYRKQVWGYAYNPTHMAGLQVFFQAFENLNTLVHIFHLSRLDVYRNIRERRITHISATPTFYRLLLPAEGVCPLVERVSLGGEKSDCKLHESILKIFPNAKINNIYASTEAGTLFAAKGENFQIPSNIIAKIKIVKNELWIHKSLLGKSDSFIFSEDYYCTGDIVEWVDSEKGIFRFKSRKNELINVGGYKVNPSEVEESILQIPDVLQAVVFGKENSVLGNILCAEVKLISGSQLTELSIRSYLSKVLQDFKIPRRIRFVESFSLTRTGKIKRK